MKKLFTCCLIAASSMLSVFAQSPYLGTATFFAEEGETFNVFINGEAKNANPAPNVKVEGLTDPFISVKIAFEDESIPPVKKSLMRGGIDCIYAIRKNKKGEYTVSVKSCTGAFANASSSSAMNVTAPSSPQEAAGMPPAAAPTPAASSGPVKATIIDNMISIGDARRFYVHKTRTPGNFPQPHIKMTAPDGAKVTITFDGNSEKFETEVPFDYEVKDYNNNNNYFKVLVEEKDGKSWYFRWQNGTSYMHTIDTNPFE